ncbi:MAG: zinc ribbon domain-containing protein [Deltaproteobacteria bacterium]|nr:zinc ribbon domain-containing protein [Deltaproteobacteria bacterium]
MPVYEYSCKKCGRFVEVYQRIAEPPLKKCKHCSGKLQKLISQSSFHLKGTGWYATDYANGSGNFASPTQGEAKKTSEEKGKKTANKPGSSKEGSNSV